MTAVKAAEVQQEYQEGIADKVDAWLTKKNISHCVPIKGKDLYSDYCFHERGQEETRDLAATAARAAGLEKEAGRMEQCGKAYSVARCNDCGEYIGHPYHCDERLCPTCYYRNLFRFMRRHRDTWEKTQGFVLVTMDYGSYREYQMKDGMAYAKEVHQDLITRFPFMHGGIYHIQLVWDEEYHSYHILYHYLLNADEMYAFLFLWAAEGRSRGHDYKIFSDYDQAERYFVRHCCQYPADILLDYKKIAWYLEFMNHRRLIQGFGEFYSMAGGLNRGAHNRPPHTCPICGGKLSFVGLTRKEYIHWDDKHRCYHADPGAPGL